MRTFLVSLLLLSLGALSALAQVAAPTLLPGTVRMQDPQRWSRLFVAEFDITDGPVLTFLPVNPAAMQWSRSSEIGLGKVQADNSDTVGGVPSEVGYEGTFGGLRWVGEYVSLGAELLSWSGSSAIAADHKQKRSNLSAAFQLFDVMALGAGQTTLTEQFVFDPSGSNNPIETDWKLPSYGISLRLGSVFYVGYSAGEETSDFRNPNNPGNNFILKRNTQAYGIAYMSESKEPWHLEVHHTSKDAKFDGVNFLDLEEHTVGVIEGQFGSAILGLISDDGTVKREQPAPFEESVRSLQLTAAWVTQGGWTLTVHLEKTKIADTPNTFERQVDTKALSAGYRF